MSEWKVANTEASNLPQDLTKPFTITAEAKTDLWRSSEVKDANNAPTFYRAIKSSQFKKIAVTISAPWKDLYDQGGIVLLWPNPNDPSKPRWIKAGIELVETPQFSCVTCDRFSDWSLHPLEGKQRIEAVRDGEALWISAGGKRIREPKWAFIEDRRGDAEMLVGVTVARPAAEGQLTVNFEDLEIELLD